MGKRKDPFDVVRRRTFARARCQARFRSETWELTYEDYCEFWPDESRWSQRGRSLESLVLARYDDTDGWTRANVAQITRHDQLQIKVLRSRGREYRQFFRRALWLK